MFRRLKFLCLSQTPFFWSPVLHALRFLGARLEPSLTPTHLEIAIALSSRRGDLPDGNSDIYIFAMAGAFYPRTSFETTAR